MSDLPPASTAVTRCRVIARAKPLVVNVQNTALMCGLSERKIQYLVEQQVLRSVLAGGRRLIYIESIRELLGIGPADEAA